MTIERDEIGIRFHRQGTLNAVTRWVGAHDEGIAEWLKNSRRAYQPDRAGVKEEHRVAVLLLKDGEGEENVRIGLLDVGGVALDDVEYWSTWQDPEASRRSSTLEEEETQGNGGKAYMFRMFTGPARIIGVQNGKRNCKGFVGESGSEMRGTPGYMPNRASGREVPITSVEVEIDKALSPYDTSLKELPEDVRNSVLERQTFTLVEGIAPVSLAQMYRGRIQADELVERVARHEQSTLALQQLSLYALHNGRLMNEGGRIQLALISPYPGLEESRIHEIPEELPLENGQTVSTTEHGVRSGGRLILYTSRENMYIAHKKLRPRWKISYRTEHQMIGAKPVTDFAAAVPGAKYLYGEVELGALEPGYVEHGRRRPKDGPLVEALDLFIAEKIRELAKEISDRRRRDLDDRALDEVQRENEKLDRFKNEFLESSDSGVGDWDGDGDGYDPPPDPPQPPEGVEPSYIEFGQHAAGIRVACGVDLRLGQVLGTRVKDEDGKTVRAPHLEWFSDDLHTAEFGSGGKLKARHKGETEIWARVAGTSIESVRVPVQVWVLDHVLLSPRVIELRAGERKQILAEITNDEGDRATDVYLDWAHDADDQMIVRIRRDGWVTGNRPGRTAVTAGAGEPSEGGVWSGIPAEVEVSLNPEPDGRGAGFPKLLLTDRDIDPQTGDVREGSPDEPALWQETSDYHHNIWWLNVASPEATFFFNKRGEDPELWRSFHVQRLMDMVVHVNMQTEFDSLGEKERPDFWSSHKARLDDFQVKVVPQMWEALEQYVSEGELD